MTREEYNKIVEEESLYIKELKFKKKMLIINSIEIIQIIEKYSSELKDIREKDIDKYLEIISFKEEWLSNYMFNKLELEEINTKIEYYKSREEIKKALSI
jgi:hypothetical protein